MQRRRFKQSESLEERLAHEAIRLRELAKGTPPGVAHEALLRRARQAETGAQRRHYGLINNLCAFSLRTPRHGPHRNILLLARVRSTQGAGQSSACAPSGRIKVIETFSDARN
jgi:hypothetical protein